MTAGTKEGLRKGRRGHREDTVEIQLVRWMTNWRLEGREKEVSVVIPSVWTGDLHACHVTGQDKEKEEEEWVWGKGHCFHLGYTKFEVTMQCPEQDARQTQNTGGSCHQGHG